MTAALYARVSTKDKGQETENQLPMLREYAASRGWTIAAEYVEEASAALGKAQKRVEFQRLFEDAHRRKFDVVLFWSLDRFSREGIAPTLQHLTRLSSYGVKWHSYTEQYLSSLGIWGDAIIGLLATIARQETVRLSERTKAGMDRARAAGKPMGRKKVIFNRGRARDLRKAGASWGQIAREVGASVASVRRACL
jgi:DNA invertase Pin-like site-specific DNA recombinase